MAEWIPVTERLPNEEDDVLFWGEWTGASGTKYRALSLTDIKTLRAMEYKPIAWMPLPEPPKPTTHFDWIKSLSVEEVAETYAGGCPNGDRLNCGKYYLHGGRDCFRCWLDWLKSPVEEVQE